ncbi:MAG: putative sulfate exporter family transporter, partial [Methanomassiliicoccales archaeon]|nr:putative sulfate exporter family transporter [Methanomassiliicoccales archaeon]
MSYRNDLKDYLQLGKKELPGLFFCALVASASYIITRGTFLDGGPRLLNIELFQENPFFSIMFKIGPIVLALVVGIMVNFSPFRPGGGYAGKYLLRVAIVLMGARVTADVLSQASPTGIIIILVAMTFTIWLSLYLGRKVKLERDAAALIGTGNAICGVSACLSVAPAINARSSNVFAV